MVFGLRGCESTSSLLTLLSFFAKGQASKEFKFKMIP